MLLPINNGYSILLTVIARKGHSFLAETVSTVKQMYNQIQSPNSGNYGHIRIVNYPQGLTGTLLDTGNLLKAVAVLCSNTTSAALCIESFSGISALENSICKQSKLYIGLSLIYLFIYLDPH